MLVFWKERLVFLAVPKTGTTGYARALAPYASVVVSNPPELKHAPLYRYNRFFRPMFQKMGAGEMELLAVIREPVDWVGSWYRYRRRDALIGHATSTRDITFEAFCAAYALDDKPAFAKIGSQSAFVAPRPNGLGVNHLFKYENQNGVRSFLAAKLGCEINPPMTNISPKSDLTLSKIGRARIETALADDYAAWQSAT